jgi:hypothetical protein
MSNGTSNGEGTDGTGQMLPPHNNSEFNRNAFQQHQLKAKTRTTIPVRVVKVYKQDGKTAAVRGEAAGAGFIDVQPVISQVDGAGQRMDHTTVYHIPFARIYGGDFALIADPVVGDIGHIHVADRDTSSFEDTIRQGSMDLVLPSSQRRHDMADSHYVGGVLNNAPKQYITASDNGITIVDKNGNKIVMDNSGITLTPANNTVKIVGDMHATGAVIAGFGGNDQVSLQTHTHAHGPPPDPGT